VIALAPSYSGFIAACAGNDVDWQSQPGGTPDVSGILDAAVALAGRRPDVVAIDMPIGAKQVEKRRGADQELSKAFGNFGAAVHSPTVDRPGKHGHFIASAFASHGYNLATSSVGVSLPALIEVFPLAALVKLMSVCDRPKYKVAKAGKYWDGPRAVRIKYLLHNWRMIVEALGTEISDLKIGFPDGANVKTLASLKPFEDALDAVVSAWVGACFLENRAQPYGDAYGAIWVPVAPEQARSWQLW
jgi:predicted RNase H-like nuclease